MFFARFPHCTGSMLILALLLSRCCVLLFPCALDTGFSLGFVTVVHDSHSHFKAICHLPSINISVFLLSIFSPLFLFLSLPSLPSLPSSSPPLPLSLPLSLPLPLFLFPLPLPPSSPPLPSPFSLSLSLTVKRDHSDEKHI